MNAAMLERHEAGHNRKARRQPCRRATCPQSSLGLNPNPLDKSSKMTKLLRQNTTTETAFLRKRTAIQLRKSPLLQKREGATSPTATFWATTTTATSTIRKVAKKKKNPITIP